MVFRRFDLAAAPEFKFLTIDGSRGALDGPESLLNPCVEYGSGFQIRARWHGKRIANQGRKGKAGALVRDERQYALTDHA